jgi:hypothetical protein
MAAPTKDGADQPPPLRALVSRFLRELSDCLGWAFTPKREAGRVR